MGFFRTVDSRRRSTGARVFLDGSGDSTFLRRGYGHTYACAVGLKDYIPACGVMMGPNCQNSASSNGGNMGFDQAVRKGGFNDEAASTGLPADCDGGIVALTGWDMWLPYYLDTGVSETTEGNSIQIYNQSPVQCEGRLVGSAFIMEVNSADGPTRTASRMHVEFWTLNEETQVSNVTTSLQGTGSSIDPCTTGDTGTIRRVDVEKHQSIIGLGGVRMYVGVGSATAVGPYVQIWQSVINKGVSSGFIHSWHCAKGGTPLITQIIDHESTENADTSIQNKMKCARQLADSDYSNTWPSAGTPYGNATSGGLGGNGQMLWVDIVAHGHNCAGTAFSAVTSAGQSWQYETTTVGADNADTGDITVADTTGFDASGGIIQVLDNNGAHKEYIRYDSTDATTFIGCTRNYLTPSTGTGVAMLTTDTIVQGYPTYDPKGFAANFYYWYTYQLANWVAAGGVAADFFMGWVKPLKCADTTTAVAGVITTLESRQERFDRFEDALVAYVPQVGIINLDDYITAREIALTGLSYWNQANTIGAAGVTSGSPTTGGTLTGGSNWGTSTGAFVVDNEIITWSAATTTSATVLARGAWGSTAAAHANGTKGVEADMIHHNAMGYREAWRRYFAVELGGEQVATSSTTGYVQLVEGGGGGGLRGRKG